MNIDPQTLDDYGAVSRTIYGEIRGYTEQDKAAVASVIMNRAASGRWFGGTPKEVCLKAFQFSCWNAGDPNRKLLVQDTIEGAEFESCQLIAAAAISGGRHDPTNGATHYYNPDVVGTPAWAKGKTPECRVGPHLFFKGID